MDGTPQADASAPRAVPLILAGVTLIALSAGLGAWVLARGNGPFDIDSGWNVLLADRRWPFLLDLSVFMAVIGGGWFTTLVGPLVGAVVLLVRRRPWSALFFAVTPALSAALVQILKHTFGRARPEDIILLADYGSYPSGHVAGAATLAAALIVVTPRVWTVVVGVVWVVLMAFSRTYLHAHWLSDTLGGALVGAGTALVIAGALARLRARERPAAPGSRRRAPSLG